MIASADPRIARKRGTVAGIIGKIDPEPVCIECTGPATDGGTTSHGLCEAHLAIALAEIGTLNTGGPH